MLVLLFIAHFISFIWPILKYLLIIFGIYLSYNSGVALYEVATTGWHQLNNSAGIVSSGAGAAACSDAGAIPCSVANCAS